MADQDYDKYKDVDDSALGKNCYVNVNLCEGMLMVDLCSYS